MVTDQMSGGTLISFVIYELELGECLEVRHLIIFLHSRCLLTAVHFQMGLLLSRFVLPHRALRPSIQV